MVRDGEIRSVELVLTTRCNLRCAYCYQTAKSSRSMSEDVLHASVDLALRSGRRGVVLRFYGGEPLLEFDLVRAAVARAGERGAPGREATYEIVTNGLLLSDEVVRFLARHRFRTFLSFDGVAPAQDLRGEGTFEPLDRRLDRIRKIDPGYFRDDLTVSITLSPANLPHLAASVDYFLHKGISRVSITPLFSGVEEWEPERIDDLEEQFAAIAAVSMRHYGRTGAVPLLMLRKKGEEAPGAVRGRPMCGALGGRNVAVDVDGVLYPCTLLCPSYQEEFASSFRTPLTRLMGGSVREPRLAWTEPEVAAPAAALFERKEEKRSSYGSCRVCRYLEQCHVCPLSIVHFSGNDDPQRVPDFCCAYNRVALRHRGLFPSLSRAAPPSSPIPSPPEIE